MADVMKAPAGVGGPKAVAAWAVAAVAAGCTAWVLWQAPPLIRADMGSGAARHRVAKWIASNEPFTLGQWVETRDALQKAARTLPDNADLQIDLANLYLALGVRRWNDEAGRKQDFERAQEHLTRVVNLRPTDGMSWARLAQTHFVLEDVGPPLFDAWDEALRRAPVDPPVHQVLLETAMGVWPQATPEMQAWVQHFYMAAPPETRKVIERMGEVHGLEFEAPPEAASAPEAAASDPR